MNYKIEHRLIGNDKYGHDIIVDIGDRICVKIKDEEAEDLGLEPGEIVKGFAAGFKNMRVDSLMVICDGYTCGFPMHTIEYIEKKRINN